MDRAPSHSVRITRLSSLPPHPPKLPHFPPSSLHHPGDVPTPFSGRRYIVSARCSHHAGDRIHFCCDFVVHVGRAAYHGPASGLRRSPHPDVSLNVLPLDGVAEVGEVLEGYGAYRIQCFASQSLTHMPLGGRISIASSTSRLPECQRKTQIPTTAARRMNFCRVFIIPTPRMPARLRRSPRSHELRICLQGTVFQQLERGLSGLEYPSGRVSVASSSSQPPGCQRDTQIPKPTPTLNNRHVNLKILRASFGCSTPLYLPSRRAKPAPRSAPSSSRLHAEQNNIRAISTLAAEMCAMPGVQTPQSHPNSLHPRTHSYHQAQLIKPLAGSISVVISRSRHRHGCKTTIPAPPCAQLGYFHFSFIRRAKIDSTSPLAAGIPAALGRHSRSSLDVNSTLLRDGISSSGCHITKETAGGVAQPMAPPISSSQLPVSDVPRSDLQDKNRSHWAILPFPHLSPLLLIVNSSRLDNDDGLYSSRAHREQRRAPTHHHSHDDDDDGLHSPEPAVEHDELGPTFDSPTPSHCPELLGLESWAMTSVSSRYRSLSPPPATRKVATEAPNARPRFWNKNGPQLPTSSTDTELRPLVTARALDHELRRRFVTRLAHSPNFVSRPSRRGSSMDPCDTSSFIVPQWVDYGENRLVLELDEVLGNEFAGQNSSKDRTMLSRSVHDVWTDASRTAVSTPRPLHVVLEVPWRARDGSGTICTSRRSYSKKSRTLDTRVRARRRAGVLKLSVVVVGWIWNSRHDEGFASAALKIPLSRLALREPAVAVRPVCRVA
ncbi:hypothetical protein DFP72DRAFT_1064189 [Ephemerocybe angulata]|uniref:Uncharacterized protein n=1 Tax=Ephemerocybe angulata TaxID=980116 RepID=A0A8H6MAV4_9AGAR|nr:hypothetical protein DFP72DRAFT_1064189 [Tulosesus angulatus]